MVYYGGVIFEAEDAIVSLGRPPKIPSVSRCKCLDLSLGIGSSKLPDSDEAIENRCVKCRSRASKEAGRAQKKKPGAYSTGLFL
jgi:hypothetical protein